MKTLNMSIFALGSALAVALPAAHAQASNSVPAQIQALQNEIDNLGNQVAQLAAAPFEVVFRDSQRTVQLAPGATEVFALGCQAGEVVVTGGYNSNPSELLQIVLNGPFFDGVHSGWRVDFHNPTDTTATVDLRISVGCTQGRGRGE